MKLFVPIFVTFIFMTFIGINFATNTYSQATTISPWLYYNLSISVPQSLVYGWSITADKVN